jgi:hypothetical protein
VSGQSDLWLAAFDLFGDRHPATELTEESAKITFWFSQTSVDSGVRPFGDGAIVRPATSVTAIA